MLCNTALAIGRAPSPLGTLATILHHASLRRSSFYATGSLYCFTHCFALPKTFARCCCRCCFVDPWLHTMFRRNQEMEQMIRRLDSLENVYGTVVPRIASVEYELRSFVARMQAVETQLGRERQRRSLAADEAEARPMPAIMGHRGPGAVMPAPAPAAHETASISPAPLLVTIATPDNASQRAHSLPPPAPALMDSAGVPKPSAPSKRRTVSTW